MIAPPFLEQPPILLPPPFLWQKSEPPPPFWENFENSTHLYKGRGLQLSCSTFTSTSNTFDI